MAQRAGEADLRELTAATEGSDDAEHGVVAQEPRRDRRIVEVDVAVANRVAQPERQRVRVDLQAERERLPRRELRDRPLDLQLIGPEHLISKRIETKDVTPFDDELLRVDVGVAEKFQATARAQPSCATMIRSRCTPRDRLTAIARCL